MQIAERRKLVSSIQSSVGDHDTNKTSHEQRENSLPNSDNTSTSDVNMHQQQNGPVLPSSYVHSTADEVSETASSAINRGHAKDDKELEQHASPRTAFVKNSTKQFKEMDSEKLQTDEIPSFLSNTTDISTINEENSEHSNESTSPMVDIFESDSMTEDMKPPPLAGDNVMNVILVAAECAPWSKTGMAFLSVIYFLYDSDSYKS